MFGITQLSVRAEYTNAGEKKQVRAQFEILKQQIFLSIVETLKLSKLMSLTILCHLEIIVRDSENEYHYFMLKLVTVETTVKENFENCFLSLPTCRLLYHQMAIV